MLLAVVTFALYFPAVNFDFVNADDPSYVTENPRVLAGLTLDGIRWAFTTWHPLTWLSLMLDAQLFGPKPSAFHTVNLFLHTANAALLFVVLRKLTKTLWLSAIVAALFAWHPLQAESVAWVSERKGLLSTLFGLSALYFYAAYAEKRLTANVKPLASRSYWLSLTGFVLALMSKPMWVTLPVLLLLLDYWPLNRLRPGNDFSPRAWFPLVVEKIPFLLLAIASSVATVLFQKSGGVLQTLGTYSMSSRIENFFVSYAHYLGKVFWPFSLATPYPRVFHWGAPILTASILLFVGLCFGAVCLRRKWPFVFVGWFWFLIALLPVNGMIQAGAQTVADRYAYVPLIGVFIVVVWGFHRLSDQRKVPRKIVAVAALVALVACIARTRDQLPHWKNSETLARHAIAVTKDNFLSYYSLGWYYDTQGKRAEAFENYRRATQIKPNYGEPWNGLGCLFADQKDFTQALACFQSAVDARPDRAEYRYNLARALTFLNRDAEAAEQYQRIIQQQPDYVAARSDLGKLLARQKRPEDAIKEFREALRYDPKNPSLHFFLGKLLAAKGLKAEAVAALQTALQLQPNFPAAQSELRALEAN